jgi:SMC interacting uncharacterized protein involved in chromosome segregation
MRVFSKHTFKPKDCFDQITYFICETLLFDRPRMQHYRITPTLYSFLSILWWLHSAYLKSELQ